MFHWFLLYQQQKSGLKWLTEVDACKWCVHSCLCHMILSNRLGTTKTWDTIMQRKCWYENKSLSATKLGAINTQAKSNCIMALLCSPDFTEHGYRHTQTHAKGDTHKHSQSHAFGTLYPSDMWFLSPWRWSSTLPKPLWQFSTCTGELLRMHHT